MLLFSILSRALMKPLSKETEEKGSEITSEDDTGTMTFKIRTHLTLSSIYLILELSKKNNDCNVYFGPMQ